MKTLGVIPARLASTRLPNKVLCLIDGKPMIEHVWRRAKQASELDDVIVACDDKQVFDAVVAFGGQAKMTKPDHPSGSDRIAEVVKDLDVTSVVNIQGDEPLIDPDVINNLAKEIKVGAQRAVPVQMATVIKAIDDQQEIDNPNVVKAIIDHQGYAIYFSRSCIPYPREQEHAKYFKHLGLYAYQKDFLLEYTQWPKSPMEQAEQLEQLRVLENGYKIKTIQTDYESVGVDTQEDLQKVEKIIQNRQ